MLAQQNASFVIISLYSNEKLPASILMKPLSSQILSEVESHLSGLKPGDYLTLLEERDLVQDTTSQDLKQHFDQERSVYVGFDPTAVDLHLGNLMGIVVLRWAQLCGHRPVVLIGGATGMIGDPSGKSKERTLQSQEELDANIAGITHTLKGILAPEKGLQAPVFVNNSDWYQQMNVLEYLRHLGRKFRMGPMLSRESVSARLQSDEGMSYTEFSYQVLQAYDFAYLHDTHGVTVQAGGSDQWGNITAGTDLIGKKTGQEKQRSEVFGLVWPLLLRKDGKKFGKSEKGAIWLSEKKLSSYDFYQYVLQLEDSEALSLLKKVTFLPLDQIESLGSASPGTLQKILAEQLLLFCRDEKALMEALQITSALKPGKTDHTVSLEQIKALRKVLPSKQLSFEQVVGASLQAVLALSGLASSKSAARRLIEGGGFYLNGCRMRDAGALVKESDLVENKWLLLASGKREKILLEVLS